LAVCSGLLAGQVALAQDQSAIDAVRRAAEEQQRNQAQRADRDQSQSRSDEAFTVKPESIAFGKRPLFTSHTETFWVRGKGKEPVRVASVDVTGGNEKSFSVTNGCRGTVKMEEDCRIDVKFEPTSAGDKVAEVRIVTGDNSVRTRKVTGTGMQAQYKVSTSSLQFGKVGLKQGGKELKLTISNTGSIALPVTATSLGGQNEKQFEQSNDCPTELSPGRTCTSTIVFRPSYPGHHEAILTVWAKGGAPETKVKLSGTGTS
jgi:hypothetical protein